jgi:enoyl-CoA hydratase
VGTYQHLIVERRGPVGWLINNRPDQLNAMNAAMRSEFADAWLELDADAEVRVIVHTGEGRAFQTGVDVSEIAGDGVGFARYRDDMERFDLHFTAWHQKVWKPVITAVNGICAGGGFHWVADADIVICASDSQFFDPHVSVGQVVSVEAIGLMRKMPVEAVMRMAFMGKYERMSAQRAYERGRRATGQAARAGPGARRDHRQEQPGGDGGNQAGPRRRARARSHRSVQARRQRARLDVGPSRPGGGPARLC